MLFITLVLAGYVALGWLWLIPKMAKSIGSFVLWNIFLFGILWFVFILLANWLQVNQELLFLFAVGIGSMGFLVRLEVMPSIIFLLFLGVFGYHWYVAGFFPTLYLFLLASVIGGTVVQMPLRLLNKYYEKITIGSQVAHGYIFSVVAFSNIILHYFLHGI